MSMTLAEYERLCESGPLGSITPEDEMRMAGRVHALAERYSARVLVEADRWKPKPRERRVRGRTTCRNLRVVAYGLPPRSRTSRALGPRAFTPNMEQIGRAHV